MDPYEWVQGNYWETWILNCCRSMLIMMMKWMSNEYAHICGVMPPEEMLSETVWWEEMLYLYCVMGGNDICNIWCDGRKWDMIFGVTEEIWCDVWCDGRKYDVIIGVIGGFDRPRVGAFCFAYILVFIAKHIQEKVKRCDKFYYNIFVMCIW